MIGEQAFAHNLGRAIRAVRAIREITAVNLAGELEITQGYLSQIEHGKRNLSLPVLYKICDALAVSMSDLIHLAEHYDRKDIVQSLREINL